MKDIDFDELDKAVNSLMASSTTQNTIASNPAQSPASENILEITTSTPDPVKQSPAAVTVLDKSPDTASVALPVPSAVPVVNVSERKSVMAPAVRRSGRFMDMVNTSTPTPVRSSPQVVPSREGSSITPRPEVSSGASSDKEPVVPTPDPVTEAPLPEYVEPVPKTEVPSEPEQVPRPYVSNEDSGLIISPAETPFLSDAKVEKRPLNAGTSGSQDDAYSPQSQLSDNDQALGQQTQTNERNADEPPVVPEIPELNKDLVAIESSDPFSETATAQSEPSATSATNEPSKPLGATSIAQQYTKKESTGDQSHAAIYDASQYPQTVHHPAKNKAGWLWIVWVVLLLGLGAGVAILLYVFGIIP